ncbi:hypothetical protein BGW41_007986 [Actinomortierella wolfii]|nr:hypothetical protein BGW41_007986 [Actinomortierella wolfii]
MPLSFPANDTTALPSTLHSYQRTYGHQGSSSSSRHAFTPSKPWFSLDIDSLATDDESVPDHNDESDHCDKDVKSTDYYSGEDSQDWPNQMSPGSPIGEGVQHEELPTPSPPQQHHYHQQDLRNSLPSSAVVSKVELPERSGRQKSMSPLLPSASFEQKGRSIASSGSNSPAKTKTPSKSVVATAKTGSLKHILPHQKPFSLSRQPNPTLPLEVQRYQATQRLAAAWQAICDKYERQVAEAHAAGHEFLDDEIDLETCEIVVDHGVVRSQKKAPFGSLTATMLQSTADTTEDSANDMHDNHHCTQSKHNKEDVELQKQRRKRARQQRQLRLARAQESESAHNHVGSASGDGDEEEEDIEGEDEEQERHFGRSAGNQRISYSSVRRTSNFLPPTDSIDGDGDEEDNLAHDTEECSENDDNVQEVGEDDEEEKEDHEANSSFDNLLDSPRPPVQFARFTDDDFDSLLSSPNAYSKRQIWRAEQPLRRLIAEEYIYERQARRHRGHAEELSEIEDQDGQDEDEEEDEEEDDDDGDGTESDGAYDGDGEYHQRRPQLSDYEQDGIASFGEEDGDDVDEHEDDIRADGDEAWDAVSHHSYDHYDTEDNGIPTLADTRPADQPGISNKISVSVFFALFSIANAVSHNVITRPDEVQFE